MAEIGLQAWHVWAMIAVTLFIAEIFVSGFVLASLGVGAILAGVVHQLAGGMGWGIAGFAIGAGAALVAVRPFLAKALSGEAQVAFGAEGMLGDRVIVTAASDSALCARHRGTTWALKSEDELSAGNEVEILEVDGATLIVRKLAN